MIHWLSQHQGWVLSQSEDWDSFSNFHNDASACQATCLRVASVQKRCHSLMCPKVPHGSCSYKSCLPTSLPIRAISAHIHYNINILLHMPSLNFLYWVEMSLSHLHVPSAQHRIWKVGPRAEWMNTHEYIASAPFNTQSWPSPLLDDPTLLCRTRVRGPSLLGLRSRCTY